MNKIITVEELKKILSQSDTVHLLDVRSQEEHQAFNIGGQLIPLPELSERLDEIPTNKPIVVYCRSGVRSQTAVECLSTAGINNAKNLIGGMIAWQNAL